MPGVTAAPGLPPHPIPAARNIFLDISSAPAGPCCPPSLITHCFPSRQRRAGQLFPVPLAARPLLSISAISSQGGDAAGGRRAAVSGFLLGRIFSTPVLRP